MSVYWDSSALVAALHDETLRERLASIGNMTRAHSFTEVFSTLTGGRLGIRYKPTEAAEMIASLREDLEVVEVTTDETIEALHSAHKKGVRGGRIHDYIHAVAASLSGSETLLTLNTKDFKGLIDGLKVVSP